MGCEAICLGEILGGFFAGIVATLGVLALIDLKSKRKEKKASSHSLETNRLWNK